MKSIYCILWMPTIIHQDFKKPLCCQSDFFEISDNLSGEELRDDDQKVYAKVELNANNNNIVIRFFQNKKEVELKDKQLELEYVNRSHNGLFKYKITISEEGSFLIKKGNDGKYQFPCDIYHKIKEFYHLHEHHQADDGDSMLKPYISSNDVDINQNDNEALLHYLHEYEVKFLEGHRFIQLIYNKLVIGGWWTKIKMFFSRNSNHHSFYRLVSRLKGDKAYYNSLFYSCYNTHIKIKDVDINDEVAKEKRRKAFNIDNIIGNIRTMEERINNKFSLSNSRISFWIAIFAIAVSIYTYCDSMASSSMSDENKKDMLEKGYIEVKQNLNDINSNIEVTRKAMKSELDSISSLIKTMSVKRK